MNTRLTTPNGRPLDEPPESILAAEAEMAEEITAVKQIDAQLGGARKLDSEGREVPYLEWQAWRSRAKHARVVHETRYRFLKAWVRQQRGSAPPDAIGLTVPLPHLLRLITRRVGLLEGLYLQVRACADDPSEAQWAALRAYLDEHRAELDRVGVETDA